VQALSPTRPRSAVPREFGFQRLATTIRLGRGKHLTACREVPSCGQQRDKLRRIGRPRGGGLIGAGGIAQPHRAGGGADCGGDSGALVIGQATVDVHGSLRACLVVCRCAVRGLEAGESACGEDGFGGVPVGPVPGAAVLRVGAEDLPGIVGGDLLLVAVGGDHADVAAPLAGPTEVGWLLAERTRPRRAEADSRVGQVGDARGDQGGGAAEVDGQCRGLTVSRVLTRARNPRQQRNANGTAGRDFAG
jgi:hypothetical protein